MDIGQGQRRGQGRGRVRLQPLQAGTRLSTGDVDSMTSGTHPLPVSMSACPHQLNFQPAY